MVSCITRSTAASTKVTDFVYTGSLILELIVLELLYLRNLAVYFAETV